MKIYSKAGTNAEIIDHSSKPRAPTGHIEMNGQRPAPEYVAQADGTWTLAGPTHETVWEAIKALKEAKKIGGIRLDWNEEALWFNSDLDSRRQQLDLAMQGEQLPADLQWKTLVNKYVVMTPALAQELVVVGRAFDAALFDSAEAHRQAMLELDDPTDYDFSTGWPQTYQDFLDEAAREEAEALHAAVALADMSPMVPIAQEDRGPSIEGAESHLADSVMVLQNDMAEMRVILAKLAAKLE